MDDILEHKAQGTFDLTKHLEGRGFPTLDVTVFTDDKSAFELSEINDRLEEISQDREGLGKSTKRYKELQAEYDELDAKGNALREKILESRLDFHLRGISPGHIHKIQTDILKKAKKEEWTDYEITRATSAAWAAPQIIRVTNAAGEVDEHRFTPEDVENLMDMLPNTQWDKLDAALGRLSFQSSYLDAAVDPGFLQKS